MKRNKFLEKSMNENNNKLKTFCPLPWTHISANSEGLGRLCCEGYDNITNDEGKITLLKNSKNLYSYFNSKYYKNVRRQILRGERPKHCIHCFNQEDHGVKSMRLHFIDEYQKDIEKMIESTNKDGSINEPKITYIDMPLGNLCNLKCRMCNPWSSYIIGKDWQKMGIEYDVNSTKKILEDKWFAHPNTLKLIKSALPNVQTIFITGGEPMLIKEHLDLLDMIVKEGHAHHILLRYNSNQTVIPEKIIHLWKSFKKVVFNCSIDAYGKLNDYIRYPSKWENLEKNIRLLDDLSSKNKNIEVYIHTTLQAYNVTRISELLKYLRYADFKNIYRFPFFIWVKVPEWLCPSIFPKKMRISSANKILESLKENEEFFLTYNKNHQFWSKRRISHLKEFCEMVKNDDREEHHLQHLIENTKKYDSIRKQSVLDVLPELKEYFA